ncbi:MAG: hypothetical protein IPJ30_18395 [Acidobacteria bacterium]|nr:hypothetical protein [Acidobacteriota bacterium]MBK8147204.1 hypothetical protein [Acidobacteriota bacterium]
MLKNMLSVVAAFIIGGICVFAIEKIGHAVYPVPAGLDILRPETIIEYVKNAPVGALLFALAAQCFGAFIGGFVTALIAIAKFPMAMTYGGLILFFALMNLIVVPHPYWFMALALLLPVPLALAGSSFGQLFAKRS